MNRTILIGHPPIEVHLHRSTRAKRYSLRVSNADGRIRLTMPLRASERAAVDFAKRQEGWMRSALAKRPDRTVPAFGGEILFEGRSVTLQPATGRRVELMGDAIHIPGQPDAIAARLRGFLKVTARERLADVTHHHAGQIGREVTRITLRDTRSRWGSCTQDGNLMFSWRLVMAPPEVLKYVAVHEVAHLVEMNHSPSFWRVVEDLMPEYQAPRSWLKQHGSVLHSYQI